MRSRSSPFRKGIKMIRELYVLKHRNELSDGFRDDKYIGVYTSEALAQEALERTRQLPGFRDAPDGFSLRVMQMDEDAFSNPA